MQPATKHNEHLDALQRMILRDQISPWALAPIKRDARALMDADPSSAHALLGCVAGLEFDRDKTDHHFRIAIQHGDRSTRLNYAAAMGWGARAPEVKPFMDRLVMEYPNDAEVRHRAMMANARLGALNQAIEHMEALDGLGLSFDLAMATDFRGALVRQNELGLNDEQMIEYASRFYGFLFERKIIPLKTAHLFDAEDSILKIEINRSVKECLALTREAYALLDEEGLLDEGCWADRESMMMVGFVPAGTYVEADDAA